MAAKVAPPRDFPYRIGKLSPAMDKAIPDTRVSCNSCRHKFGSTCTYFKHSHVPIYLTHHCGAYKPEP